MPANRRYLTLTAVSLLFATACIGGAVTMGMTGKRIWDIPVFGRSESVQPLTNQLSPEEVQRIARSITVKVLSNKTSGSGILVGKKGANGKKEDIYSVLTNRHVLVPGEPYRIQTPDGKIYQANVVKDVNFKGSDLALLQFNSAQDYTLAELMSVSTLAVNQQVFAAGFVSDIKKLVFTSGEVSLLPDKAFQDGYQIGYTNNVQKGMSGGPILNQRGEVIGINGIIANPIWGDPYVFKDGSKPNSSEREKMSRYSWGIAIKSAVEISPEFVETNQVKELDRIAEEITVRIDFPNGNGSGAIIAKKNGLFTNNYYILTAYHVVDEAVKYQVVTPDGRRHSVDYSTVKRLPGVDLAVLQFTSNQNYRVASLASNSVFKENNITVCVSGWPVSNNNADKPSRLFSVGETINSNSIELVRKNSSSLTDGYKMVYSNITAGGVSGGPILDIEGQVIGIHGRADGEETIDQAGERRPIQLGYSFGIPISKFLGITSQIGVKIGELKIDYRVFPDLISDGKTIGAKEIRDMLNFSVVFFKIKHLDTFNDPIELTNYANRLWRTGQYEDALAVLNRAIQIQPKLYQAWYLRGLVLHAQQSSLFNFNKQKSKPTNQEILASFSMATIIEPKFSAAWLRRGISLQLLERYEEAIESINEGISLDSKDSRFHQLKGDLLTKIKQYEEAIAAYTRSIELQPDSYASYFNRGLLKYDYKKDQKGALSDYTEAIKLDPDLVEAYANRGVVRDVLGDTQGALDDYAQAIKLKPDYAEVYARRGMVHFLLKNKKEALADYEKAIRLKPNYAEAYLALGSYYFDSENLEAAITSLTKAISLNRNLFAAYSLRAAAYYKRNDIKLNDIQKAITDFTQAVQINPDHLKAYQGRGKLYYNIGNYQNAILDFSQVIRLKSNDLEAYNNRGVAYLKINNPQNALNDFDLVIELNYNLSESYLNRGITKSSLNDYSGAINDLTQAIERPSSDNICTACAYKIRGIAQSQLGNRQGAVADLEKAVQLFREQGDMAKYQSALDLLRKVQK